MAWVRGNTQLIMRASATGHSRKPWTLLGPGKEVVIAEPSELGPSAQQRLSLWRDKVPSRTWHWSRREWQYTSPLPCGLPSIVGSTLQPLGVLRLLQSTGLRPSWQRRGIDLVRCGLGQEQRRKKKIQKKDDWYVSSVIPWRDSGASWPWGLDSHSVTLAPCHWTPAWLSSACFLIKKISYWHLSPRVYSPVNEQINKYARFAVSSPSLQ